MQNHWHFARICNDLFVDDGNNKHNMSDRSSLVAHILLIIKLKSFRNLRHKRGAFMLER